MTAAQKSCVYKLSEEQMDPLVVMPWIRVRIRRSVVRVLEGVVVVVVLCVIIERRCLIVKIEVGDRVVVVTHSRDLKMTIRLWTLLLNSITCK